MSEILKSIFTPKLKKTVNYADVIKKLREREANPKILESLGLANAKNIVITPIEDEPLNPDIEMDTADEFDKPEPLVNKNIPNMAKTRTRGKAKPKAQAKTKHVTKKATTKKKAPVKRKCKTKRCTARQQLQDERPSRKLFLSSKVCMKVSELLNKLSKYNKLVPS